VFPDSQGVIAGAALFIALTAVFDRAERKYGEGVYRSVAAEAGCLAQNLLLVATAMGLRAGPFTAVFDDLLNRQLGLEGEAEEFILGVVVGHSDVVK
jgi:SagB-type dehydrogenase family enzyme